MLNFIPELWVPIPGYEGFYNASTHGRIRSLPRPHRREHPGGILKPQPHPKSGHMQVRLSRNGIATTHYVHRLMAATFLGPCPKGQHVRHWDGNPANNVRWNLLYGTPAQNMRDMVRHGRSIAGTRHPFSNLRNADVADIRIAWQQGFTGVELAASYGLSPAAVSRLVNGHTYRNGEVMTRPQERCHYPGCDQFAEMGTNRTGKPKVFCPDLAHNRDTAARERDRLRKVVRERPLLTCLYCDSRFTRKHSRHIYCSRECKVLAKNAAAIRYNRERVADCEGCGTGFRLTRKDRRFCSVRCRDNSAYARRKQH